MGRRGAKNGGKNKQASFNMVNGVRLACDTDNELYAAVLKIQGGGMCLVRCQTGEERACVIRQKFRGRDKKGNMLAAGTWVLVGLRDWERVSEGKKPKCDLLEVYNAHEKDQLIQTEKQDLSKLIGAGVPYGAGKDTEFDFVDAKTQSYRDAIEGISDSDDDDVSEGSDGEDTFNVNPQKSRKRFVGGEDETVDIDDI
jgi:translation initiation factor IF-1